jgi:hypothetical protein
VGQSVCLEDFLNGDAFKFCLFFRFPEFDFFVVGEVLQIFRMIV